jgi:hypothetical protein
VSAEAIFTEQDGRFVPSEHGRGPWDAAALHGGAPAALLARAFERLDAPGPMLLARFAMEFAGAVPMAPLEVHAEVVRPGRRLQLAEATLSAEGQVVCRARATRIRREPVAAEAPPEPRLPAAEDLAAAEIPVSIYGHEIGFGRTGMELRFAEGAFTEAGPATAWFRLRRPLVAGEEPTPTQRLVAAADFGNGMAAELGFDSHLFVNTDLTVGLSREPVGEWIALEGVTEHGEEGTALAASVLHDAHGPVGRAMQSLYVAPR